MGLASVKAFSKIVSASLDPGRVTAGVPTASPAAAAYVEFPSSFGIGSLTAELPLSTVTATGSPDPTDDYAIELLVQYFSGAAYNPTTDEYSGGSWINLLPPLQMFYYGTTGTKSGRIDLNFESPLRPPIDLHQSLLTQVRSSSNVVITNQKKRHFVDPNTHRHTYSGGITADNSGAAKPFEDHSDFRIWARHLIAETALNSYAVPVTIGLV